MTAARYASNKLTVAIVSYNARTTIGRTLTALAEQSAAGFETLVVDSSHDETHLEIAGRFPSVRLIHVQERLFPGKARNVAVREARGELLAFVDADCVAAPDWVERILAAHNDPRYEGQLIIGGSVGAANPESLAGWASFFCEFSPWLRWGRPRLVDDIPTCCYSMKREAFARFGPFDEEGYCSDTTFNWRAVAGGQPPLFMPAIHVRHENPTKLARILEKQGMHGERFGTVRARQHEWSRWRARIWAGAAPFLPIVLWLRTARRAWRAGGHARPFLLATPLLAPVLAAWCLGEARAYWRHGAAAR